MATVPGQVVELVKRFERFKDDYKRGNYKEAQVRREFIDPLFEALGWDVNNKQGRAESQKQVIHEDVVKIDELTKAPDYGFRLAGERKFFLEAKKPAINLAASIHPAYQLRRYAWSAKLPLSILTDFEEFVVYDGRVRPAMTDTTMTARLLYMEYGEYADRWQELADNFSLEAVRQGSIERLVAARGGQQKGTVEVDAAFLQEIERWRAELASDLALRNPGLTQRELNHVVQLTIDRIIFLRICEDRGIESYGTLMALQSGPNVYQRLIQTFHQADDRYNSGLFHFGEGKERSDGADQLTPRLKVGDRILQGIFGSLYYPHSPYEFSVISADILGQVYEQFLGKVIRLTGDGQAVVEDKPEVKKAGGVYYTPTYIVNYIVKQTLSPLVEGHKPDSRALRGLRLADPACGSGSFLLGAYQFLLDWYRDWYVADDPAQWSSGRTPRLYQLKNGEWRLTTDERKRLLLTHIYGVDIDPQAVEVTRLSLLLKVLEGETRQTMARQLSFLQERVLPDLGRNIKCGNSLVGPDYWNALQTNMLDQEEVYRVNPFDWHVEFPQILADGGFDVVIGNPPWGADFSGPEKTYLRRRYAAARGRNIDSYALFIEDALAYLKPEGLLSYITPDTFLRKDDYLPVRQLLFEHNRVLELVETGPVFSKVRDTWCLIFRLARAEPSDETYVQHRQISRFIVSAEERLAKFGRQDWDRTAEVPQRLWLKRPGLVVGYMSTEGAQQLLEKLETNPTLGQLMDRFNISRGEEGSKYNLEPDPAGEFSMLIPKDINRYQVDQGIPISPGGLAPAKVINFYRHPKIWIIRIQKMRWKQRIVCGLDERCNSAGMKTLQIIVSTGDNLDDLKYLQGILASKLMNFWCTNYLADDMNKSYLERIPICLGKARQDSYHQIGQLAEWVSKLNRQLVTAQTPQMATILRRQVEATDRQLNELVYRLYDLSADEVKIVEGR